MHGTRTGRREEKLVELMARASTVLELAPANRDRLERALCPSRARARLALDALIAGGHAVEHRGELIGVRPFERGGDGNGSTPDSLRAAALLVSHSAKRDYRGGEIVPEACLRALRDALS